MSEHVNGDFDLAALNPEISNHVNSENTVVTVSDVTSISTPQKKKPQKEPLRQLTIRVSQKMYNAIATVSQQKSCSMSSVCRLAFADRMVKFLGCQNYVDIADGKKIIALMGKLVTEVERIRWEINRIGLNYNSQIRLMHIREKYKDNVIRQIDEKRKIENGINVVRIEEIQDLIKQQDAIIRKAGELACTLAFRTQETDALL